MKHQLVTQGMFSWVNKELSLKTKYKEIKDERF